ncbi:MAG: uridine kinase [Bacteroidales bacterium]|jgi:uridine kinase|nr:uridine kinase [Bacteroidales bacterium]
MLVIGVAGGSGSGKTTVVKEIVKSLPRNSVSVLYLDSYYKDNAHLSPEEKLKINFDHPSSFEFNLLIDHIDKLKNNQSIEMPTYSYITCGRTGETTKITPKKVVIIEGILTFSNPRLRDRMDIKVFVDADSDDRLMRIIKRDIVERGRNVEQVLRHYETFVKPMHLTFIEPTKRYADIIVPQGGENQQAIEILASSIRLSLNF